MKRIFISFAKEDIRYRDLLVGQSKNPDTPFEFVDMSVKEPWSSEWKTQCRTKIKGCDGMIALVSSNTPKAEGARWEIRCAKEEDIPMMGMYVSGLCMPPLELTGVQVIEWSWDGISNFVKSL